MPRKSTVKAVPVEQVIAEPMQEETKTDAEELTELVKVIEDDKIIITEVAVEDELREAKANALPEVEETEVVEEVAVKPKAKRAPKAKKEPVIYATPEDELREAKAIALPVNEVTYTINEIEAMVDLDAIEKVQTKPKANNKVECPDCGKSMSAKTLRYSHGPNCLFKKQADKEEAQMNKVPEEVIEAEVQKRMSCAKAERLNRRQKQIESLVANAF